MYGFPIYSPRDYITSPSLSLISSPVPLSTTDATPTKLKRKRTASTKAGKASPTQPAISSPLSYKPTISKAKASKTVKTVIEVLDKTIEDRKDNKE